MATRTSTYRDSTETLGYMSRAQRGFAWTQARLMAVLVILVANAVLLGYVLWSIAVRSFDGTGPDVSGTIAVVLAIVASAWVIRWIRRVSTLALDAHRSRVRMGRATDDLLDRLFGRPSDLRPRR